MKIDVLTVEGSPKKIIPSDLYERGVGGAEKSLIELMEVLGKRGHSIRIYNNPTKSGLHGNVWYLYDVDYNPYEERDILITYRGPSSLAGMSKKKKHIAWSTDQYTIGDYTNWHNEVDKFIVISEYHKNDHLKRYKITADKIIVLDLGVNIDEYNHDIPKVRNQCIYCSVPDRGLTYLVSIWPQIKNIVPDATLLITSDYTLWGSHDPLNMQYRLDFAGMNGVKFLGKVNRSELVKLQLSSELQLYPCLYEELFCIANAECQSAGIYTITSEIGALKTTNFLGSQIIKYPGTGEFMAEFIGKAIWFLRLSDEEKQRYFAEIKQKALVRFDWNKIADEWEKILINE